MAKLPSFDSQIDKARADAHRVHDLSSRLAQSIGMSFDIVPDATFEAETAQMSELRTLEKTLEADLLTIIKGFASQTDAAYAAFDKVEDVPRRKKFVALFTKRDKSKFKTVRFKKLAIADRLKFTLVEAAAVHDLLSTCKDRVSPLVEASEPKLADSMGARRKVVSSMDDARQRDKALAASIATLQRKIANAGDETQLSQWRTEETEATAQRDAVLAERRGLTHQHGVLDRQALLLGDFIDLLNDEISLHTLLLDVLTIEIDRCIQLYAASYGTLEPLLTEASEEGEALVPLAAFRELLTLHAQGAVTMQDIERRKTRADAALLRRDEKAAAAAT